MRITPYLKTGRNKIIVATPPATNFPEHIVGGQVFVVSQDQNYVTKTRTKLTGLLKISGGVKYDPFISNNIPSGSVYLVQKYSPMFSNGTMKLDGLVKLDDLLILL